MLKLESKHAASVRQPKGMAQELGNIHVARTGVVQLKPMEADMVVSMVKQTNQMDSNVLVKTVVGDEDAASIAKLRKEVNAEIEKKSDNNHVKTILGNELLWHQKGISAVR